MNRHDTSVAGRVGHTISAKDDVDDAPDPRALSKHATPILMFRHVYFDKVLPRMGIERGSVEDRDLRQDPVIAIGLRPFFPIRELPLVERLRQMPGLSDRMLWTARHRAGCCPDCGGPVDGQVFDGERTYTNSLPPSPRLVAITPGA